MARTRLTQEARKARTREALIDAAALLFARRGVDATSLDEVALAAGFTKGAIYASFPNKQALIDAVVERHLVQRGAAPLPQEGVSLADRLGAMGRMAAELIGRIPRETVILDLEYRLALLRNPRARHWIAPANAAELARVPGRFAALNKAQRATSPFSADELFFLMATLVRGLALALAERPGAIDPAGIETLFRLLGGEGPARPAGKGRRRLGAQRPMSG